MAGLLEYSMLSVLMLYCYEDTIVKVEGRVTISPPEVAPVCDGDQLELNCTILTGKALEWRIIPKQNNNSQLSAMTHYPTKNMSFEYGGSTITFTIISHLMQQTSYNIVISAVNNSLNGTEVRCIDLESQQESSSTIIIANAQDFDHQQSETIRFISKHFSSNSVEVTLEWTPENSLYSYHVHITPQPSLIVNLNRSVVQLKILYNVLYNVSVVKMSPCGQMRAGTINELYYVNCGNPTRRIDDFNIYVEYKEPTIEGSYANFSCYPGYELTGFQCMDNGKWVPDPQEFEINCTRLSTIETFNFNKIATTSITTNLSDSNKLVTAIAVTIVSGGFLLLLILAIVSIAIFVKRKGSVWTFNRDNSRVIINNMSADERDYVHDHQIKVATKGLVYAEVPFKQSHQQQNDILDLDDTRVEYVQLNHNQLVKTCSPSWMESQLGRPQKPNDDSLYVNLDNLLIQLRHQVTPKWFQFGEAVGIEKEMLDYYASKCSPEECIVEILDFWLRNSKEQVTWKEVARVLKAINLQQLALDIESIYTTGKLPVEVDMSRIPNFQDLEPAARVAELLPPPVPPKKAAQNEHSSQDDLFQNQQEPKEIAVPGPVLPPKPKTTFISDRRDNAPTRPPK